jgi:glycosyltransferase involved in cell wall biosynthesis
MPTDPRITVIIPTYNRAGLLGRAVRSVLAQTYADFELIIADDASTDETENVVRSFGDPRIVFVRREENGGNAVARNLGLRHARGAYITFLDSDDEFLPGFLEAVVAALDGTAEEVGFVWTGRYLVFTTETGAVRAKEVDRPLPRSLDRYISFLAQFRGGTNRGLTVKRRCFDEVGAFDERLRAAVDTDFVLRLVQRYSYREIATPLVVFHQHAADRVSQHSGHKALAYSVLIEKHERALREHRDLWVRFHHRTARLYYDAGDGARARVYLWAGLRRHPAHLKSWMLLLLCEALGVRGMDLYRVLSRERKLRRGGELRDVHVLDSSGVG